jgi:mRNA-degrading endonuclease RelE of RelBE toxin-antitoxin system
LVFVEASHFSKHLPHYLADEEYRLLQKFLAERPDAGAIIRGAAGIRKARWAARGKGKSGGVRVIYYWQRAEERIHLLLIYGKGEQADLTAQDLRRVKELLEQIDND